MPTASVRNVTGEPFTQEFEEIFQEHYNLVYCTAYGVTGRVEDAEDVVQTIFLRLLKRNISRDFMKNPRGYFYRAAVNLSLTVVQTRNRRSLTEAAEDAAVSILAAGPNSTEELHRRLTRRLRN
jgi:RNA polymerase sigma factor (sigma-70 family)